MQFTYLTKSDINPRPIFDLLFALKVYHEELRVRPGAL